MDERLTIRRVWCDGYEPETRYFSLDQLLQLERMLDLSDPSGNGDGFSEFITGLHCDSYADQSCDIMKEVWYEGSATSFAELYDACMCVEDFQTCYTVYRIWNPHLTQEQALSYWRDDCLATMESLDLEDR